MKPDRILTCRCGATLLELVIAMAISSLVIIGVYQVYRFVTVSALREKQKAEIQRDIITLSNLIERDIRMAGCNLPGNGVTTLLQHEADDRLSLYSNESRRETALAADGQPGWSKILVADTAGFKTNGYACIAATGVDTIYKKITGIGVNNSGSDTLYLNSNLYHGPFPVATTHVYPAIRIRYQVYGSPVQKLFRVRHTDTLRIGGLLDSLNIIPKNAAGTPIGFASDQASVITVLLGGHVGTDGNRTFIGDSIEVNIRNIN